MVGDSVYLHCYSEQATTIQWTVPGASTLRHQYDNGTLRVSAVRKEDGGFYTCTAGNSWGTQSYTVLLSVIGKWNCSG